MACGILASLLYAGMNGLAPLLYEGYDSFSQTVSELSAIGAPTRTLWMVLGTIYSVLYLAFGIGIWISARESRPLRVTGILSVIAGIAAFFWAPMHQREVLAMGGKTLTDTMHVVSTALWALLTLVGMGFAAAALGRRFRALTVACMAALILFGLLTSGHAANMEADLPTPWMGVWERLNILAFDVWLFAFAVTLFRRESRSSREDLAARSIYPAKPEVRGFALPGFERVRDAFEENFRIRNELGGACCIYHDGEKVVDLWGGVRDVATGAPWDEHTMVIVYSATKGLSAMTLALAHSRGWLDYDERVCTYWPEFAQNGKGGMTVRQLLAHHGGLHAFDERVDKCLIDDQDRFAEVMARQRLKWPPGSRQAYHAISLGFYENELLRRVDPKHRSLGRFFQEEIAVPLELEFYIRVPNSLPNSRLAVLESRNIVEVLMALPWALRLASLNPLSDIFRALIVNPGSNIVLDRDRIYARELEVPSGGGVGTARGIARAYSAFLPGAHELGVSKATLEELMAPARPSSHGFYDEALKGEVEYSLGFMKPCKGWPFGHEGAFGAPGAGGAMGYADPATGIAYAYVTNRMGTVDGDPRDVALRAAIPELPLRSMRPAIDREASAR